MTDPLTPAECDLRGNDWMPLHGHKLYNSWFDAHATDAEWRAAHKLWWFAWNEVPAASVPDDDVQLCKQVGLGRDMKAWLKIKEMALHGFVKCSDGRLYHQFIAPEAVVAYEKRLKADTKRAADRERLKQWRDARKAERDTKATNGGGNAGGNGHETRVETPHETEDETRFVAGGQDKTRQDISLPPVVPPPVCVAASRGSRLTDDWEPDRDFAVRLGLNADAVLAGFRDYWRSAAGAKGRKADWQATWRNWCRKEAERLPLARASPSRQAESREKLNAYLARIPREDDEEPRFLMQ